MVVVATDMLQLYPLGWNTYIDFVNETLYLRCLPFTINKNKNSKSLNEILYWIFVNYGEDHREFIYDFLKSKSIIEKRDILKSFLKLYPNDIYFGYSLVDPRYNFSIHQIDEFHKDYNKIYTKKEKSYQLQNCSELSDVHCLSINSPFITAKYHLLRFYWLMKIKLDLI